MYHFDILRLNCNVYPKNTTTSTMFGVSSLFAENSYLNVNVPMDDLVDTPHAYRNDRVYENEDVSFNVMDVLEDTVKKSVSSFCIETSRLKLGDVIGKGELLKTSSGKVSS